MTSEARTGRLPAIPEDTLEIGDRVDPARTLLRRTAEGDEAAAGALVDLFGPRTHGLALHVTGSAATAHRLTVSVLRSCVRDAAALAASGLPGEAAVLDRARRAAVATRPTGDVRSLVGPEPESDRTRVRREADVVRVLLELPPGRRALVESAAQGRFRVAPAERPAAALVLADALDLLVPFGGPQGTELRGLAALDALALAEEGERARLRELTLTPESAGVHRHAVEAAARLALLTALAPSRDLRAAVLEGFRPAAGCPPREPAEAAYGGTYQTPVLGMQSQRRTVGPPAQPGGVPAQPGGVPAQAGTASPARPLPVPAAASRPAADPPAFAFSPEDEAQRRRRAARRDRRARGPRAPWLPWSLAALAVVTAIVLGGVAIDARAEAQASRQFAADWAQRSTGPGAQLVRGLSDNGEWTAVIAPDGFVLHGAQVQGYDGEVLQLWGERDGVVLDLGVLEPARDGEIRLTSPEEVDRLEVTRESAPENTSGTPSPRLVARLDPGVSGV